MARAQTVQSMELTHAEVNDDYAPPKFKGEEALGYCLRRAQVSVFREFTSAFSDIQLRPVEFSILTLVHDNPGRKQTEICGALGISRANLVPIIDSLETRELVERRLAPKDRRSNRLYLTASGKKFIVMVHKRHEALEESFTTRIGGPAKRAQLVALLRALA